MQAAKLLQRTLPALAPVLRRQCCSARVRWRPTTGRRAGQRPRQVQWSGGEARPPQQEVRVGRAVGRRRAAGYHSALLQAGHALAALAREVDQFGVSVISGLLATNAQEAPTPTLPRTGPHPLRRPPFAPISQPSRGLHSPVGLCPLAPPACDHDHRPAEAGGGLVVVRNAHEFIRAYQLSLSPPPPPCFPSNSSLS